MCTKNEGQLVSFCSMNMSGESYKEDADFRFLPARQSRGADYTYGVGTQCARNRRITKMNYQQLIYDTNDVFLTRRWTNFFSVYVH